jgi:hypothetical protein
VKKIVELKKLGGVCETGCGENSNDLVCSVKTGN